MESLSSMCEFPRALGASPACDHRRGGVAQPWFGGDRNGLQGQQHHTFPEASPSPGHQLLPGPWRFVGLGWLWGGTGGWSLSSGSPWCPEPVCQPLLSSSAIALFMPALGDDLAFAFYILDVGEPSGKQVEMFYWCCFC